MKLKKPEKEYTFNAFNFKWGRVQEWSKATEHIYHKWYLDRYGYKTTAGLRRFLKDKQYILEAGCGQARDSKLFAELNSKAHIVALDQSENALQTAHETLARCDNCEVVKGDITNFSHPYTFDFISCDQVVHHTPEPAKTLKHFLSKLKKGGVLNFSVCRKKNKYRDLVDDVIMEKASSMSPEDLWEFARAVTMLGKALHDLEIKNVRFEDKKYATLQRYVHDNVFRCWYNPDIDFELSVSSNYDWFSNNPRFSLEEVEQMLQALPPHKVLRVHEDDATISLSLEKQ